MEKIFSSLEQLSNYKDQLKLWCRFNGLKISFTVSVSLPRAKTIYKKLLLAQSKANLNPRIRWMENQLKLFHFILLALSTIHKIKISEFNSETWGILLQSFPNKQLELLQFEAACFILDKNSIKKKWDAQEDKMLIELIQKSEGDIKWNDIAIEMFIKSEKKIFRMGKQCRERWLNHLDHTIKHERWSVEQDEKLIQNVINFGKKWSRIMKIFGNLRTQHMIKNRFISLVLRYKKDHPFVYDEEEALKGIARQMGIIQEKDGEADISRSQRSLRNKQRQEDPSDLLSERQSQVRSSDRRQESEQVPVKNQDKKYGENQSKEAWQQMHKGFGTPTTFFSLSPVTQFIPCGSFVSDIGNYCQWWLCSLSEFKSEQ